MIATIIYAMPPMVRVTLLSLRQVPSEIKDFGQMVGTTRHQLMWKVLVPSAVPGLMVGVNQVIMLSLNMVIIASMIGAGGLGYDVLNALRTLDIGGGIEAGLAIVALAIGLDRLSQAFASERKLIHEDDSRNFMRRHPYWVFVVSVIGLTYLLMPFVPAVRSFPEAWTLSTDQFWGDLIRWVNVNYFDELDSFKTALLLNFMLPVKKFLISLPWLWVTLALTLLGFRLGQLKLALMVCGMCLFIVLNGLWFKAMVTVYLCGIAVLIATLVGVPLGIWAAQNRRAGTVIGSAIDTLQTLPSFVYLIPVVMLFRVGDFTALVAVVLYAIAPVIRYTTHGISQINGELIEAGIDAGCTPRQLLFKVKLPVAIPEIMLGINQTIMLALSMLVITALVGTRDLGQEVYIALTSADTGRGLVAGLCIAFIAIIADRLIHAMSVRSRQRMGLA
jgi:glycine betaine/proline transport system permease protein